MRLYFKNKAESSFLVIKYINYSYLQIVKKEDINSYTIYLDECLFN